MRIAVTVEQSWHAVPGGIGTVTIRLLQALVERGDLDLVGVSARHREPPPESFRPPVPIRQLPLPRRVLYETWQRLRLPVVERATGAVDVVHDAGYVVPPAKAPLVATVHDLLFLTYPEHYSWHSRAIFERGLVLARRHARLVICPSMATMDACRAAGIEVERLRLVPWGVSVHPVERRRAGEIRGGYGLARPYILFCGTLEPRKNLRRVLEAFRRLDRPDLDLVLVGPRGWKEDLADGLRKLEGRVRPLGFVPPEELSALYAGAAAFVYPSLAEGFGLPVLEAMAHGAPVVTSLGTATEEVAGDAALLVDPLDVDAIAGALARILDDEGQAATMRAMAAERATGFTWLRSAELVARIYAEAAGAGS
ncbi:MAG TPA: glycosyltransferase family 1 protein [Actinomycetota bacterium]|nr:glycosyltransferase family 1 protein [Actinomycetota bacterium]